MIEYLNFFPGSGIRGSIHKNVINPVLDPKLGIQFRNYQFLVPFPRYSILYKKLCLNENSINLYRIEFSEKNGLKCLNFDLNFASKTGNSFPKLLIFGTFVLEILFYMKSYVKNENSINLYRIEFSEKRYQNLVISISILDPKMGIQFRKYQFLVCFFLRILFYIDLYFCVFKHSFLFSPL